jgi:hypothetical protein
MNKISNILVNPLYFSSISLLVNIPYTFYVGNYHLLLTEIPICFCSIVYHNKIYNIRKIDIFVGQLAYWQHMYYCNNDFSRICWIICPIIYSISSILNYKKYLKTSNFMHSLIHYFLTLGTIYYNYRFLEFTNSI